MAYRIQQRRDYRANWETINPMLLEGEEGFVLDDPNLFKIGDGVHTWNELPYRGYTGTIAQTLGNNENAVASQKVVTEKFTEQDKKLSDIGQKVEGLNNKVSETLEHGFTKSDLLNLWVNDGVVVLGNDTYKYKSFIMPLSEGRFYKQENSSEYVYSWYVASKYPEAGDTVVRITNILDGFTAEEGQNFLLIAVDKEIAEYKVISTKKGISQLSGELDFVKQEINILSENTSLKVESLNQEVNKIDKELGTPSLINFSSDDLLNLWVNDGVVAKGNEDYRYKSFVIPVSEGRFYKQQNPSDYIYSWYAASKYPEVGDAVTKVENFVEGFTAQKGQNFLLIGADKAISEYVILEGSAGISKRIEELEGKTNKNESIIVAINKVGGVYYDCSTELVSESGRYIDNYNIVGYDEITINYPTNLKGSSCQTIITDEFGEILCVAIESGGPVTIKLPFNASKLFASSGRPDTTVTLYKYSGSEKIAEIEKNIKGEKPLDRIDKSPIFVSCFKKIYFIGDSLTEGVFNTYTQDEGAGATANYDYSVPTFFKKHTGVETYNAGIGSQCANMSNNAYSWFYQAMLENRSKYDNRGVLISDENIGDAIVIALGVNDIARHNFDGNPDTDIDLSNKSNNALTSCGGYGYIIQTMREYRPKAPIFCVTISNESQTQEVLTSANNKIKAIASKFENTHIIDLQEYAEPEYSEWAVFKKFMKNGDHNNALGYSLRAKQLATYMDWIIRHKPLMFRNIAFITTNDKYEK